MGKSLLVVESPTKMKTLSKYLGKDFVIKATYGHIKDLPKSKLGVDVEEGFKPHFHVLKGKSKVVDEIKKAGKEADKILDRLRPGPRGRGDSISRGGGDRQTGPHRAGPFSRDHKKRCPRCDERPA